MNLSSTTAGAPGVCLSHGAFAGHVCPYCSTSGSLAGWFPVLLLFLACSGSADRAPRPDSIAVSTDTLTLARARGFALVSPALTAETTYTADTVRRVAIDTAPRRGDTVFFNRQVSTAITGLRKTTSVESRTDSTWFRLYGIPFGPSQGWASATAIRPLATGFSLAQDFTDPTDLLPRLATARSTRTKLVLVLTGGDHGLYLTAGKFDFQKWLARLRRFDTPVIRQAVTLAVQERTVVGATMLDEPFEPSWNNSISKAMLDQMADSMHRVFPTLPVGYAGLVGWRAEERTRKVDWASFAYRWPLPLGDPGNLARYLTELRAYAQANNLMPLLVLNLLDGGPKEIAGKPATAVYRGCPEPLTGGKGSYAGPGGQNCRMTPQQIVSYGTQLALEGCGLLAWRYDAPYLAKPAVAAALNVVGQAAANLPWKPCRRS